MRKRIARTASRKQKKVSQRSWRMAPFMFVWTSLPDELVPTKFLEIYRLRWQIQLAFKRIKSILNFWRTAKKRAGQFSCVAAWKVIRQLACRTSDCSSRCYFPGDASFEDRRSRWREVVHSSRDLPCRPTRKQLRTWPRRVGRNNEETGRVEAKPPVPVILTVTSHETFLGLLNARLSRGN